MSTITKAVIYLLVIAAAAVAGFLRGRGSRVPEIRTIEKEVVRTETKWKDRIVTVTRVVHPDGTVEEKTTTEEKEGESSSKSTDEKVASRGLQPNYSLGVNYGVRYSDFLPSVVSPTIRQVEVEAGRRLIGPVWGQVGVGFERVTLGIRVEF